MSKCTDTQAVNAMMYWEGYYEKASSQYVTRRDKAVFELDKGSANMTYPGYYCGIQGGAWCAMMVSTAIAEACGNKTDAKSVMYGVWPYAACNQLYDAAPTGSKGRRGAWNPKPGDVIVFGTSSRDHTGMVYAVDGSYVYTIEGNSSNMCKRRSYLITSTWIWGYVRPDYADGVVDDSITTEAAEQYGPVCITGNGLTLHTLSKGVAGPEVKTIQRILYSKGIKDSSGTAITADGDFGKRTEQAVKTLQKNYLNLDADGVVGKDTWTATLTKLA